MCVEDRRISPIPKIDEPVIENDFRPGSILPALSKVFERLVLKQVIAYIDEICLLATNISGFRKGHSLTSVLLLNTWWPYPSYETRRGNHDGLCRLLKSLILYNSKQYWQRCTAWGSRIPFPVDGKLPYWSKAVRANRRKVIWNSDSKVWCTTRVDPWPCYLTCTWLTSRTHWTVNVTNTLMVHSIVIQNQLISITVSATSIKICHNLESIPKDRT